MMRWVIFAALLTVSTALSPVRPPQQGGDQFLDGIGETALVARYLLESNTEDRSRNNFHATLRGRHASEQDPQFNRPVLLLTGDGSYVELPANTLAGEDTLSVTGWLFLPTGASGTFFDFGQSPANRLSAVVSREAFRASVLTGGAVRGETAPQTIVENQWVHLAIVLDPAAKTLTTYVDGKRAAQATNVAVTLTQIVEQAEGKSNRLFLGRSQSEGTTLHARLRDVRLYRIALTDQQIATIRNNAVPGRQMTRGRGGPPPISMTGIPK